MIVIAIIGILAAALFPSLTSYLARGRDTSRVAGIKEIVTAFAGWQLDKLTPPPALNNGGIGTFTCVNSGATNIGSYLPKFPVDPTNGRFVNCSASAGVANGAYGYGTGTDSGGTSTFAISAVFENANGGNTGSVGPISNYQGNGFAQGNLVVIDGFTKGTGSGYVVRN